MLGRVVSIAGTNISAKVRNRIQVISIAGRLCDRYFAIASELPRNSVEQMSRTMPRNGRSVRAGTDRRFACVMGSVRVVNAKAASEIWTSGILEMRAAP